MTVSESDTATPANQWILRIISGMHSGASRLLGEQEMLLIGSGDDCDIVLSDPGVARHHAMVMRHGENLSLRAIDAPLGFAGDPLEPGDPIDLPLLQPAHLGDVAFAIGTTEDPAWARLGPVVDGPAMLPPPPRSWRPNLPTTLAAVALLSLVSVAILAGVRPDAPPQVSEQQQITTLVEEFHVADSATTTDPEGMTVLTGTVADSGTRDRLRERIKEEGLPIHLNLRTGDDIAADVREVLRTQGINAKTAYLGEGRVEVSGHFDDPEALRRAWSSRAMIDIAGFKGGTTRNFATIEAQARQQAERSAPVRVIAWVGGDDPHVLTSDGARYTIGSELPDGRGKLIALGKKAWVERPDKSVAELAIDPAPASETPVAGAPGADDVQSDGADAPEPSRQVAANPAAAEAQAAQPTEKM